jgi:hypothetical protein
MDFTHEHAANRSAGFGLTISAYLAQAVGNNERITV